MVEKHFIYNLLRHYSEGADKFERSYIRAMGESLVLSALSGASIYSGVSHVSPLEISLGFSSFVSSFAFHEVAIKGFLRRYGERSNKNSI